MYQTNMYEGMLAETVTIHGFNGDIINAYFARPLGAGPFPGMVLIHHLPGWDEWYREATRKFAHHGYATISPNLYYRDGHGTPEDVAAKVRAAGGVPDDQIVGDVAGAMQYLRSLPYSNGKVGIFGTCSGRARCLGSSARKTRALPRSRSLGMSRSLRTTARPMSFICIPTLVTASFTMTGQPTGRSRQWTAGKRYSLSSKSISAHRQRRRSPLGRMRKGVR